jgi:hypothetical protein
MVPRDCNLPLFRTEVVDQVVWDWVSSFLTNPENLEQGLVDYQRQQKENDAPLHDRLKVIDELLTDYKTQLERLIDLYLSGNFPMELLVDRKTRLETTITSLETERAALQNRLQAHALTKEQIQSIKEFAHMVGKGLRLAEDDFDQKRKIIELLNVRITLALENQEKVVYAECLLNDTTLTITSKTTGGSGHNRHTGLVLTARLAIDR